MLEREISRRAFFGIFMAGAFSSGLSFAGLSAYAENSGNFNREPRLDESIKIGNLELSVLVMEHTRTDWLKHQSIVRESIDASSLVIPEYFPPEYSGANGNYFTERVKRNYEDANYLFDAVAEYCTESRKEVCVVDPAYNTPFMALRVSVFVTEMGLLLKGLSTLAEAVESRQQSSKRNFTERMKDLSIATLAFGAGFLTFPEVLLAPTLRGIVGAEVELGLRPLIAAQLIKNLSTHLPVQTRGLGIYPDIHWKNIRGYLENDEKRTHALSRVLWLRNIPGAETLFQGRRYRSDGQVWSELQKFGLQVT